MPAKWWRFGQEATPEAWKERVKADVAASAPQATVQAGDGPAVPVTGMSIEITAPGRTLAEVEAEIRAAFPASVPPRRQMFPCSLTPVEADAEAPAPSHAEQQRALWAEIDRLPEGTGGLPHSWSAAVGPAGAFGVCQCGRPYRHPLHLPDAEREAGEEDSPETTPLPEIPKPGLLPDGVLGYSVATRRTLAGGGWLATADIMTREIAEHTLKVTGGTLVEIRAVER